MPFTLVQTGAPAAEPILWDDTKVHLRIDDNGEQAYVEGLIVAARCAVEEYTQRQLITATWQLSLDEFPVDSLCPIELARPPIAAITSVYYLDEDGVSNLLASTEYQVDARSQPGRLTAAPSIVWPVTQTDAMNTVTILYTAGYGAAGTAVPRAIRLAMYLLVGEWYENREAVVVGSSISVEELPMGVKALLGPYRVMTQR